MADSAAGADAEILYIADPMCSWCWGFAPVAEALRRRFSDAGFSIIVGGLRPGESAEPLDDRLKATIEPHWRRVAELSGQPFDFSFFERENFLFDTEPACRAVVVVRRIAPARSLDFLIALQTAFYAENRDVTVVEAYPPILEALGIDTAEFLRQFGAAESLKATYQDFMLARRLGATGFPTVVLRRGRQAALLSVGYQPYEALAPAIAKYFSESTPRES